MLEDQELRGKGLEPDVRLGQFLALLKTDMQRYPNRVRSLDGTHIARIDLLVKDVNVSPEKEMGEKTLT